MRVLVLGAAVSGMAAARLAVRTGHDVTVYDADPASATAAPLGTAVTDPAIAVATGAWRPEVLAGIDLVVTSPGIPEAAPPIVDALEAARSNRLRVVAELEFASAHLDAPYVAVTGTNGKTTVTETAAAMLTASGLKACAAGNVGLALSDVALEPWDCVVVEASSFQLRFIDRFRPDAAAVLNVAPDHLDWHGGFAGYLAAKTRIHENQRPGDIVAYDPDDPGAVSAVAAARSQRVPISGTHRPMSGNGPQGGRLHIGDLAFPVPDLDAVWLFDVAVAATLAAHVGAEAEGIAAVAAAFTPGAHRRTVVAEWSGITWVDDSKATNPHAAVAAAGAYPSVILIAGGRNKGLDLSPLTAVPSVRRIVAIGEAAPDLASAGGDRVDVAADLADAVRIAASLAMPGDTVLLAPGAASFDMFTSYAARGDAFVAEVAHILGNAVTATALTETAPEGVEETRSAGTGAVANEPGDDDGGA